jgi:hypothetical protein
MTLEPPDASQAPFSVSQAIYDEIEDAFSVRLSNAHRLELRRLIRKHVHRFREWRRAPTPAGKSDSFEAITDKLSAALHSFTLLSQNPDAEDTIWIVQMFEEESQPLSEAVLKIEEIRSTVDRLSPLYAAKFKRQGRRRKEPKRDAIWAYADFFEASLGANATASYRADLEEPHTRFLRFLHIIRDHLPPDVREDFMKLHEMARDVLRARIKKGKAKISYFVPSCQNCECGLEGRYFFNSDVRRTHPKLAIG